MCAVGIVVSVMNRSGLIVKNDEMTDYQNLIQAWAAQEFHYLGVLNDRERYDAKRANQT